MDEINIKWIIKLMLALVFVYIIATAYVWIGAIATLIQDGVATIVKVPFKSPRTHADSGIDAIGFYFILSLFKTKDVNKLPFWYTLIGIVLLINYATVDILPYDLVEQNSIDIFQTIHFCFIFIVVFIAILIQFASYFKREFYFDYNININNNQYIIAIVTLFLSLLAFNSTADEGLFYMGWFADLLNSNFT